jgi:hypothetical protein
VTTGTRHTGTSASYDRCMYVIHLTDAELEMARHALRAYLSAFGHDEAETVGEIKRVIAKLNTAQTDGEDPRLSA